MARPGDKRAVIDDPVVDWGPDAGQGLFDPPDVTGGGEPTGRAAIPPEVSSARAGRDVTASPARERPMAVLAWIGATLSVNPGRPRPNTPPQVRLPGDGTPAQRPQHVPALAALLADEPLELLPGGFFPAASPELSGFEQDSPETDSPALAAPPAPTEPTASHPKRQETNPDTPRLQVRPKHPEPSGKAPRVLALLLGLGLASLFVQRGCG
ncbi:MAG: hypothetical protein EXR69_15490 [Myxococcales bacterium]|nr:hypothetical protein [Myxococcales bacterium]